MSSASWEQRDRWRKRQLSSVHTTTIWAWDPSVRIDPMCVRFTTVPTTTRPGQRQSWNWPVDSVQPLKQRVIFIGFTAEEEEFLEAIITSVLHSSEDTVAMINFDMIGMYGKQGITLGGANTAGNFRTCWHTHRRVPISMSNRASRWAAVITPGSTTKAFQSCSSTGLTDLYHTPDDDFETIDVEGAATTIDLAERVIREIAELPERPTYTKVTPRQRRGMVYLGVTLDFENSENGVGIQEVAPNSPAAKAGVKSGDVIIKIGDNDVKSVQDLPGILRQRKPGDEVDVIVKRDGNDVTLKVKLTGPPRNR